MLKTIMSMKVLRVAAVVAAAAFLSLFALRSARAASTTTGTFNVTATVVSACTLGTVSNLAFGNYDPTAAIGAGNGEASTNIGVTCTSGTPYTVTLSYGNGTGASSANRFMTDTAGDTIAYNLYMSGSYTNVWENATDCTSSANCVYQVTGSGTADSYTVYGQIASTQATPPPVGSYSDTITVTVSY